MTIRFIGAPCSSNGIVLPSPAAQADGEGEGIEEDELAEEGEKRVIKERTISRVRAFRAEGRFSFCCQLPD
jgi:hypothetical protein